MSQIHGTTFQEIVNIAIPFWLWHNWYHILLCAKHSMNNADKNSLQKIKSFSFTPVVIFAILGLIVSFFFLPPWQKQAISNDKLLTCFTTTSQGKYVGDAPCLERVVNELMETYATSDLLQYISSTTSPSVVQANVHSISHFIGKQTFKQTQSIEVALELCALHPQDGCLHGVIGAAAASEPGLGDEDELAHNTDRANIEEIAKKYCASNERQWCHAVGHVLFQVSRDYPKALTICDQASGNNLNKRETCALGVFMESSTPLNSLSPSQSTLSPLLTLGPCEQIATPFQHACFRYLPIIEKYLSEKNKNYDAEEHHKALQTICEKLNGHPRADCIEGIGFNIDWILRDINNSSLNRQNFCQQFDNEPDKQACVLGVTWSFIKNFDFNGGLNYCSAVLVSKLQNFCYYALFQISEYASGSRGIGVNCDKDTNPETCTRKLKEYLLYLKPILPNYALGLYGGI